MFDRLKGRRKEKPSAAPYPETLRQFHGRRIEELVHAVYHDQGDLHTFEDPNGNVYHSEVTGKEKSLPETYVQFIEGRLKSEFDSSIQYAGVTNDIDKGKREIQIAVELANSMEPDVVISRQVGRLALF